MFIDGLNYTQCWKLWHDIFLHPVKTARILYPNQPPMYVSITKLVGAYLSNKGTALSLAKDIQSERDKTELNKTEIANLQRRKKVYIDIAAEIYTNIPAWARSIKYEWEK
jgi:hypothetical protein